MGNDWRYLKRSEIQSKRRATTPVMERSLAIIEGLKPGLVAEVRVADGMTVRGQKGSLSKAAKSLGVQIEFIEVSAGTGDVVYVALQESA